MNYLELVTAIQTYTENQFPDTYLSDGTVIGTYAQINRFIEQAEQRVYNTVQFPALRKNVRGAVSTASPYLTAPDDFLSVYSMAVIENYATPSENYTYLLNKDVNFIRQAYPSSYDVGLPKYYALFGPTVTGSTITNELSFMLGPKPDANYNVELHYYYYPESIVQGRIGTLTNLTGGTGYANGTYIGVTLTSVMGAGQGATATVVVSGNSVSSVTLTSAGCLYVTGDTLTADAALLGGTGAGFTIGVNDVKNSAGQTWLGDNFDTVLLYGCLVEAYTFMKGENDMIALYDNKYKEALGLAKRLGDGLERSDAYRSGQAREMPLPQNNGVK